MITGLWADKPKPPGDIGAFALRAPENVIRAECGKEIDIWAVGCMVR
jgi:serine/threonine-protein kinase SRPK3